MAYIGYQSALFLAHFRNETVKKYLKYLNLSCFLHPNLHNKRSIMIILLRYIYGISFCIFSGSLDLD